MLSETDSDGLNFQKHPISCFHSQKCILKHLLQDGFLSLFRQVSWHFCESNHYSHAAKMSCCSLKLAAGSAEWLAPTPITQALSLMQTYSAYKNLLPHTGTSSKVKQECVSQHVLRWKDNRLRAKCWCETNDGKDEPQGKHTHTPARLCLFL